MTQTLILQVLSMMIKRGFYTTNTINQCKASKHLQRFSTFHRKKKKIIFLLLTAATDGHVYYSHSFFKFCSFIIVRVLLIFCWFREVKGKCLSIYYMLIDISLQV